jgi:hypothetical protein
MRYETLSLLVRSYLLQLEVLRAVSGWVLLCGEEVCMIQAACGLILVLYH